MKRIAIISVIALILVFTSITFIHVNWQAQWSRNTLDRSLELVVDRGESTNSLLSKIASHTGVIPDSRWYRKWRTSTGLKHAQAGEYEFPEGATPAQMWQIMVDGKVKHYAVTLVEGTNVYDVVEQLRGYSFLDFDLSSSTPEELALELGLSVRSAEGQFAADTYHVPRGTKASSLLNSAHDLLEKWLEGITDRSLSGSPLDSAYEVLIMASIVEKETAVPSERPLIAGVFSQRLRLGMRLQTDPTVIYGLLPDFNGDITRRDLRTATPWNTYVIRGLPPTPIALVSQEAINAVLDPVDTKYLYFVAKGDGSHYFSETLEEHNRAVRRYQLGLDN